MFQNSYFNPRSPYGERLQLISCKAIQLRISIHAPLTGSDYPKTKKPTKDSNFNPRSPYGGATCTSLPRRPGFPGFQSTLPLRGATSSTRAAGWKNLISIHAPLTGSDPRAMPDTPQITDFNPRSPYGERQYHLGYNDKPEYFNPRSPYGERQNSNTNKQTQENFNPRSPYGERQQAKEPDLKSADFNPRSPYGERLSGFISSAVWALFQSTLPLRGATNLGRFSANSSTFQSTLPLRGATSASRPFLRKTENFNPRSPYGERPAGHQ